MKIKKDIPLLKVLTKLKGEDFKAMVDTLSDDSVDNVCECVYNLIYNPSLKIASRKKIITDEHSGRILVDSTLAEEEREKMEKLFSKF